jgi:glycine C-acetyltransferase
MPDDAKLSQDFANALLDEGIYVIGFYFPVGRSRIRVQISTAHTPEQIVFALEKFRKVGKRLGAI